MADKGGRTPEEREAARREREARRAKPAPQPFGRPSGPPAPWKSRPEPPEESAPPVQPVTPPVQPVTPPVQPVTPPVQPVAPPVQPVAPPVQPVADDPDDWGIDEDEPELHADEPELHADEHDELEDYEVPAGTKVVYGAPEAPAAQKRPRRGRSIGARVLALIAIAGVLAVIYVAVQVWQPFHGASGPSVTVVIPHGSNTSRIGDILVQKGVISSSFFFGIRAGLDGGSTLYAGTYHFRRSMTFGDVLKALTTPPPPIPTTQLTITEGKARSQIDRLLRAQGVKGSYRAATRSSPLLSPRAYGGPRGATLEGFLFPSTYDLREPVSIAALVADQLAEFKRELAQVNMSYARSKHLTLYEVLTVGSIVEAEAATAHDRPLVASVIYNRLKDHIPLGMDSTTRYAVGNYTTPLTASQLASPSPYNTRNRDGLPPGPIDNPGLAAIQAAAHPALTSFLYFVVKPCGNGSSVFSSNYNQFLADAARYQTARAKRGGRSPERC